MQIVNNKDLKSIPAETHISIYYPKPHLLSEMAVVDLVYGLPVGNESSRPSNKTITYTSSSATDSRWRVRGLRPYCLRHVNVNKTTNACMHTVLLRAPDAQSVIWMWSAMSLFAGGPSLMPSVTSGSLTAVARRHWTASSIRTCQSRRRARSPRLSCPAQGPAGGRDGESALDYYDCAYWRITT